MCVTVIEMYFDTYYITIKKINRTLNSSLRARVGLSVERNDVATDGFINCISR